MSEKIVQTAGRNQLGEFSPMFAHLNDDVLVGAAKDSWFSHLAIEVSGEKASTEWCEPVSEEDYNKLK